MTWTAWSRKGECPMFATLPVPGKTKLLRYPTFGSAIRDLDDALCLCFAFATLPHTRILKEGLIDNCRRLTAEFMHYVIEAHALKNTFISIKVGRVYLFSSISLVFLKRSLNVSQ